MARCLDAVAELRGDAKRALLAYRHQVPCTPTAGQDVVNIGQAVNAQQAARYAANTLQLIEAGKVALRSHAAIPTSFCTS